MWGPGQAWARLHFVSGLSMGGLGTKDNSTLVPGLSPAAAEQHEKSVLRLALLHRAREAERYAPHSQVQGFLADRM